MQNRRPDGIANCIYFNRMPHLKTLRSVFLLITIIFISCLSTKNANDHQNKNPQAVKSEIVFLTLRIRNDSIQQKNVIEFVNKTKSEGKIKTSKQTENVFENFLTIDVYEKDELVNSMVIEHPLFKRFEFQNGDSLASKNVELKSQEFFIRFQINDPSTELKIYETLKNDTKRVLTTIKL